MRAGVSGIAAESAVAAVVAAKIGQRQENFSRVGDDAGLEVIFCSAGGGEQRGQIVVGAADQAQGQVAVRWAIRAADRRVLPRRMCCAREWRF